MVTICTTSLAFNNSTFCSHSVFMCFVWISEQTAIISLYSINWLVSITETESVYCAVRAGSLNTVHISGHAIAATLSRCPLTAKAWVRFQVSPYETCGGHSDTGQAFLPVLQFSPVSIIPPLLVTHPLDVALTRTNGRSLGTFAKAISSQKSGSVCQTSADT